MKAGSYLRVLIVYKDREDKKKTKGQAVLLKNSSIKVLPGKIFL